jgi:hypothetical protein
VQVPHFFVSEFSELSRQKLVNARISLVETQFIG